MGDQTIYLYNLGRTLELIHTKGKVTQDDFKVAGLPWTMLAHDLYRAGFVDFKPELFSDGWIRPVYRLTEKGITAPKDALSNISAIIEERYDNILELDPKTRNALLDALRRGPRKTGEQ